VESQASYPLLAHIYCNTAGLLWKIYRTFTYILDKKREIA